LISWIDNKGLWLMENGVIPQIDRKGSLMYTNHKFQSPVYLCDLACLVQQRPALFGCEVKTVGDPLKNCKGTLKSVFAYTLHSLQRNAATYSSGHEPTSNWRSFVSCCCQQVLHCRPNCGGQTKDNSKKRQTLQGKQTIQK